MAEGESHRERPPFTNEGSGKTGQPPNFGAGESARKVGADGVNQWFSEWKEQERKSWEKMDINFIRQVMAERRRGRKSPEHTEFSPREKQFIAMGEIGAKLADLRVDGEDQATIFARLAKNPELTGEIADILKTIPAGDKTLAEAYMKTAGEEMKRLTDQLKYNPEEAMTKLKWWELVLLILAGILAVPSAAVAETVKETQKQAA